MFSAANKSVELGVIFPQDQHRKGQKYTFHVGLAVC